MNEEEWKKRFGKVGEGEIFAVDSGVTVLPSSFPFFKKITIVYYVLKTFFRERTATNGKTKSKETFVRSTACSESSWWNLKNCFAMPCFRTTPVSVVTHFGLWHHDVYTYEILLSYTFSLFGTPRRCFSQLDCFPICWYCPICWE